MLFGFDAKQDYCDKLRYLPSLISILNAWTNDGLVFIFFSTDDLHTSTYSINCLIYLIHWYYSHNLFAFAFNNTTHIAHQFDRFRVIEISKIFELIATDNQANMCFRQLYPCTQMARFPMDFQRGYTKKATCFLFYQKKYAKFRTSNKESN